MTSNGTRAATLIAVLASGLAACGGAGSGSPTAPTASQLPRPTGNGQDTYQVADVVFSGVVYELTPIGRVPIEGVRVQSDYFHVFPIGDAVTDSQGFFSFKPIWVCPCSWAPWVVAGVTLIMVEKDGYESPAAQPDTVFRHPMYPAAVRDPRLRDVTIAGDTRFDVELVRRE